MYWNLQFWQMTGFSPHITCDICDKYEVGCNICDKYDELWIGDLLPLLKTVCSSWKVESPSTELRLPWCAWWRHHDDDGDDDDEQPHFFHLRARPLHLGSDMVPAFLFLQISGAHIIIIIMGPITEISTGESRLCDSSFMRVMFLRGSYPQKRLQDISKAVKSILCQNFAKQLFFSDLREISAEEDEAPSCVSREFLMKPRTSWDVGKFWYLW